VRHDLIVLPHVESDEPAECRDTVEVVEVEPLVLEGAPPSFDEGVREGGVSGNLR
jgi:hypothetical protein